MVSSAVLRQQYRWRMAGSGRSHRRWKKLVFRLRESRWSGIRAKIAVGFAMPEREQGARQ